MTGLDEPNTVTFHREVAEVILRHLLPEGQNHVEVRDTGLFFRADFRESVRRLLESGEIDALLWTPASELEGVSDAARTLSGPALPIPFTANQLAAWAVAGLGFGLQERFGNFEGWAEPGWMDEVELAIAEIDGPDLAELRDALRMAYRAVAHAAEIVGSDVENWRRAIVCELLAPKEALVDNESLEDVSPASLVDVEPLKAAPRDKQRRQERAILDTLTSMGFDPKQLPPRPPNGMPWVPAKLRPLVLKKFPELFAGKTGSSARRGSAIVDGRWQDMFKSGDLAIRSEPSAGNTHPPQKSPL